MLVVFIEFQKPSSGFYLRRESSIHHLARLLKVYIERDTVANGALLKWKIGMRIFNQQPCVMDRPQVQHR